MSLTKRSNGSFTSPSEKDWAYQDFTTITSTSVTLTADQNGTTTAFNANNIINGYAFVSNTKGEDLIYSGAVRLFSTKISVTAQNGASLTLNAIPNSAWGTIRIWYLRTYPNGIPVNHLNTPGFIKDSQVVTLDNLFITEEEMATHKAGSDHDAHNDARYDALNAASTVNSALNTHKSSSDHDTHNNGRYDAINSASTVNSALNTHKSSTDHDSHNDSRYAAIGSAGLTSQQATIIQMITLNRF
jgi:hypothetical protein